jgi:hypothetical protein
MKWCSKCEIRPRRSSGRYCTACHAAFMREWRKTHPLNPEQRKKDNARSYAGVYLRRGKIERKPCQKCGEKAEMHHEDYSKPLEVTWLCRECHLNLHAKHIISNYQIII